MQDADTCFECACGSIHYILRQDGFLECSKCHRFDEFSWDFYKPIEVNCE